MSTRPPDRWLGTVVMAIAWVGSAAITLVMQWSWWATIPLGLAFYVAGWAVGRNLPSGGRHVDAEVEPADLRLVRRKHR